MLFSPADLLVGALQGFARLYGDCNPVCNIGIISDKLPKLLQGFFIKYARSASCREEQTLTKSSTQVLIVCCFDVYCVLCELLVLPIARRFTGSEVKAKAHIFLSRQWHNGTNPSLHHSCAPHQHSAVCVDVAHSFACIFMDVYNCARYACAFDSYGVKFA